MNKHQREAVRLIKKANQEVEGNLTFKKYNQWAIETDNKKVGWITHKFGYKWSPAMEAAGLISRKLYSKSELLEALRIIGERCDGFLTIEKYDELREEGMPAGGTIAENLGWENAKEEVGLLTYAELRRYTDQELIHSLWEAKAELKEFKIKRYNEWAERNNKPKYQTIYLRIGSYKKIFDNNIQSINTKEIEFCEDCIETDCNIDIEDCQHWNEYQAG